MLFQHMRRCLKAETLEAALQKCIFSDQLPPFGQSLHAGKDIVKKLYGDLWLGLVAGSANIGLSDNLYEAAIARYVVFVSVSTRVCARVRTCLYTVAQGCVGPSLSTYLCMRGVKCACV